MKEQATEGVAQHIVAAHSGKITAGSAATGTSVALTHDEWAFWLGVAVTLLGFVVPTALNWYFKRKELRLAQKKYESDERRAQELHKAALEEHTATMQQIGGGK